MVKLVIGGPFMSAAVINALTRPRPEGAGQLIQKARVSVGENWRERGICAIFNVQEDWAVVSIG
jgi:hypothetical protein